MPEFAYSAVETATRKLAHDLRWRWRQALKDAAALFEDDLVKAIDPGARPPRQDQMLGLDTFLRDLTEQAGPMLSEGLATAIAAGSWSMQQADVTKQPSTADLAATRQQLHFQDLQSMRWAASYSMALVQSQDASVLARFKVHLLDALREGKSPKTAAAKTAEALGDNPAPWERIARTEMARAQHMGAMEEAKRLGVEYIYVPDQPSACQHCQRLLGNRVFPADALDNTESNAGKKPTQWVAAIPLHPNCTCVAISAAASLVDAARERAGGAIPTHGVRVDTIAQPKDR